MFKKIFILFFMIFTPFVFAQEEVIQGMIKYNEANARIEAFKNIERKIEKDSYKNYLKDPNRKENLEAISKDKFIIGFDRSLCPFYLKSTLMSYAVTYFDEPLKVYYYNIFGSLIKLEIVENKPYPKRTFAYSRYGNLLTVNFDIDGYEQFVYQENGKLIAHWVENNYEGKHSKIFKITRGEKPQKDRDKE